MISRNNCSLSGLDPVQNRLFVATYKLISRRLFLDSEALSVDVMQPTRGPRKGWDVVYNTQNILRYFLRTLRLKPKSYLTS